MKRLKTLSLTLLVGLGLAACSSTPSGYVSLKKSEIDRHSYAVGYTATAQTYDGRVTPTYDIQSFIRGVQDWYQKNVPLPVEQIRATLINRMLDHDVYAYYSGVLYASDLQANFTRLSPHCWAMAKTPSLTQGVFDAMTGLQKNKVLDSDKFAKDLDEIIELCVKQIEKEEQSNK